MVVPLSSKYVTTIEPPPEPSCEAASAGRPFVAYVCALFVSSSVYAVVCVGLAGFCPEASMVLVLTMMRLLLALLLCALPATTNVGCASVSFASDAASREFQVRFEGPKKSHCGPRPFACHCSIR